MINMCKHCGELLTKVSADPDDQRYRHSLTYQYECNLPPDGNGWRKNAVLMVAESKEEWLDYQHAVKVKEPISKPQILIDLTDAMQAVLTNHKDCGPKRQAEEILDLLIEGGWVAE